MALELDVDPLSVRFRKFMLDFATHEKCGKVQNKKAKSTVDTCFVLYFTKKSNGHRAY